jgi:hypothetical protein
MDTTAGLPSRTLIPFDPREGITTKEAAGISGRSQRTIRRWCEDHRIGRSIAGGNWIISRPALQMLIDGDLEALAAYRDDGVRGQYPPVAEYFRRVGLADLLQKPEFGAPA